MNPANRSLWNRSTLLSLALPTLVITLGLQTLRVYFPSLAWYLRDTVGVGSATLGGVAFASFLPGFLAPALRRALGSRGSLWLAGGGVAVLRLAEQISVDPALDLWLSLAGTACLVLFVPLFIVHARAQDSSSGYRWAGGLLLGIVLDTTIKGAAGSLDLSWIPGVGALAVVAILAVGVLWLLGREPNPSAGTSSEVSWREASVLLVLGPMFLLGSMVLQNQGWVAQVSGVSASLALVLILLGNLAALAGLITAFARPDWARPLPAIAAAGAIFLSGLLVERAGALLPIVLLIAQLALGWGLGVIASSSIPSRPGAGRTSGFVTVGLILYLLLAFIYYVSFDLALPIPRPAVLPGAAAIAALAVLAAGLFGGRRPALSDTTLLVPGLALALLGAALAMADVRAPVGEVVPGQTFRVMTYNIHSAFSSSGRLDPESIALAIEGSGADFVSLQEVSRGWLIDGSTDLVDWLGRRLGMAAFFVGTADPIWGNALLSRNGFLETGSAPLPLAGTLLPRGYLWARVDVGGEDPWLFVGTHLHHVPEEPGPRLAQLPVILSFLHGQPRVLLMGDLNAEPGWPEMALPREAGLVDSWEEAGQGPGLTWPADDPFQRIDWIWHTPDLRVLSIKVVDTAASDHRPVVADLSLP